VATLNLFDITSKYCTNALFININVQKLFDAEFISLHTLKFLPIIPVCVITISHLLVPKYTYIRSIIPQNVVLAHQFSEFSVLTHTIPGKIISEKHIYVMFVEHAVAVNCLYCQLLLTYEMLPSVSQVGMMDERWV
jgi:hypothetical protein